MSNTGLDRDGVKAKFDVSRSRSSITWRSSATAPTTFRASTGSGPKTGAKLARTSTATLDALIAHVAEISGKVGENLRNELAALELSRRLATIDIAVTLDVTAEDLVGGKPDVAKLQGAVHATGAAGARARAGGHTGRRGPSGAARIRPACGRCARCRGVRRRRTGHAAGRALRHRARAEHARSLGGEARGRTARLDRHRDRRARTTCARAWWGSLSRSLRASAAVRAARVTIIPVRRASSRRARCSPRSRPLLEDALLPKLGRRLKFDAHVLANNGIELAGHALRLHARVVRARQRRHPARLELGRRRISRYRRHRFEDLVGKGAKQDPLRSGGCAASRAIMRPRTRT